MSLIFSQLFDKVHDIPYQVAFLKVVPTYAVFILLSVFKAGTCAYNCPNNSWMIQATIMTGMHQLYAYAHSTTSMHR